MKTLQDRISYAANTIHKGRPTSRRFDSCFEEGDGDAVVAALVKRAETNPKLKENLPRYIAQTSIDKHSPRQLAEERVELLKTVEALFNELNSAVYAMTSLHAIQRAEKVLDRARETVARIEGKPTP